MTIPADDPPQRHTGYLIRRAQQVHVALWSELVSTEITSVQYSILASLDRRGPASQRDLCDDVDLDRSTIADLVTRMERRGLLTRRRSTVDTRRNVVELTDAGLQEYRRLTPLVDRVEVELTRALTSAQRTQLRAALRTLLDDRA